MLHAAISLSQPTLAGNELTYVQAALQARKTGGGGPFGRKVEDLLVRVHGSAGALLTSSCTHALEVMALLLEVAPGDEVIVPAFTFVSTANAFVLRGARPVFADVCADTLNIDPRSVEQRITPRTRAIVVVHYGGVACDMDALLRISEKHGIPLLEDNAHGLYGRYQGRPLGSFGLFSAVSFHETKNFVCGEGGALIVNDARYVQRAEIIRDKGTDRSRFLHGQVDKYTWQDLGSSYVMSDILAGVLLAQLEEHEGILERRRRAFDTYESELKQWSAELGVARPVIPEGCEPAWHLYYLLLAESRHQAEFIENMRRNRIGCAFHYLPLNQSPYIQREWPDVLQGCPVAESAAGRLVRLPLHAELSDADLERVVKVTRTWRPQAAGRSFVSCALSS
jgi:dTDP-4-amino-4,6-dideoxygalactose transaminase